MTPDAPTPSTMARETTSRAPKAPTWSTVPCKHGHCVYRGTIHPEHYHTARDGSRFDRMA